MATVTLRWHYTNGEVHESTAAAGRIAKDKIVAEVARQIRLFHMNAEAHPERVPGGGPLNVEIVDEYEARVHGWDDKTLVEIIGDRPAPRGEKAPRAPRTAVDRPNIYAALPRVIYVASRSDAGEYGAAVCPHCGADGRYVYELVCEDGSRRGAMKGCLSKFPQHPFAARMERILDKEAEIEKENRERHTDRKLAGWDVAVRDAIRAYGAGNLAEDAAWEIIRAAEARKADWLKRRGYR